MSLETKHSYKNKKFLQKEISKLDKNEVQEIFNIFCQSSDAKYSENSRGVFINLKFVNDDIVKKLIEFIQYSKTQDKIMEYDNTGNTKVPNLYNQPNHHPDNKFTLSKACIEKELLRLREKTPDNFTFQNFLDKLSISNIKDFQSSSITKDKIIYPQLKHVRSKFDGVKARLLQKCRDVNKSTSYLPFIPSDELDTKQTQSSHKEPKLEVCFITSDVEEDDDEDDEANSTININNLNNINININAEEDDINENICNSANKLFEGIDDELDNEIDDDIYSSEYDYNDF